MRWGWSLSVVGALACGSDTVATGEGPTDGGNATNTGGASSDSPAGTDADTTSDGDEDIWKFDLAGESCDQLVTVAGDLFIDETTNPSSVLCIERVLGHLGISRTTWRNMSPLANLRSCGGLGIASNQRLTTLTGLEQLETVEGGIYIAGNRKLESIEGLSGIVRLAGLTVHQNASLLTLDSLRGRPEIVMGHQDTGTIDILANYALEDLDGFLAVEAWDVDPALIHFRVEANDNLTDASGVAHLLRGDLGGADITFGRNELLEDLQALRDVTRVGNLMVWTGARKLTGLEALQTVDEDLTVAEMPEIEDLSPLGGLESVGGHLKIGNCWFVTKRSKVLTALTGLETLTEVGTLTVEGNLALADISALNGLADVDPQFEARFHENTALPVGDIVEFMHRAGRYAPTDGDTICDNAGQEPHDDCPCGFTN